MGVEEGNPHTEDPGVATHLLEEVTHLPILHLEAEGAIILSMNHLVPNIVQVRPKRKLPNIYWKLIEIVIVLEGSRYPSHTRMEETSYRKPESSSYRSSEHSHHRSEDMGRKRIRSDSYSQSQVQILMKILILKCFL